MTTAAPLISTATQAFNNLVDADYVAAFPGDADQAAVSGAWTSFFNAMAIAAQTAITTEASAYQAYINGMAADIQTTMNNMAGEATALAGSYGAALVNLVSTVGAAATLHDLSLDARNEGEAPSWHCPPSTTPWPMPRPSWDPRGLSSTHRTDTLPNR